MSNDSTGKRFRSPERAGDVPKGAPEPRVRMVPAGGHFAKRTVDVPPAPSPEARPAGRRFKAASPSTVDGLGGAAATSGGTRFAANPATMPRLDASASKPAVGHSAPGAPTTRVIPDPAAPSRPLDRIPRGVPLPSDTFANLTGPSLDRGSADTTASAPVPGAASVTSRLENGSASLSAPAPAATAEFMAMAAGSPRARRAPSPGEALPTAGAVSPSPVASHGIEPPAPPRRRSGKGSPSGSGEPPRRRRNVLSTILIALGTVLLIAAAAILIHALIGYRQAQATYDELRQYAVQDEAGDGVPVVDFDELARINPDVVGWIYVPGTVINYPVVQTDDNTTYLTRLFDLSGNGSGTIFMDMDDTAPGVVDEQTTLYGHHMNDGSMFKAIDDTLNQEAFDKIGKIYYITRENTFVFRPLFTSQVVDTYVDARKANFGDGETLAGYLDDIHGQAVSVAPDAEERMVGVDQVLSLVTCAGEILPRTTRAVMVCSLEETIPHQ